MQFFLENMDSLLGDVNHSFSHFEFICLLLLAPATGVDAAFLSSLMNFFTGFRPLSRDPLRGAVSNIGVEPGGLIEGARGSKDPTL